MKELDSNEKAKRLKAAQDALKAGHFSEATTVSAALLAVDPANQDALYMAAVSARYLGAFDEARHHLQALKQASPDYGRAYQEEGHLLKSMGDHQRALTAFQHATRCNPALLVSWKEQSELLRAQDRLPEAQQANAQLARLEALPRELIAVTNHLYEGRILKAEDFARAFLRKQPHHIEGMRLLADIGTRLGVHEDADFILETASELEPKNVQLRIDHIQVLRKRQKFAAALAQAKALLDRDPHSPVFLSLFAIGSLQAGDFEGAIDAFDRVLEQLPNDPVTLTSRGHALKTYGRSEEAIASYRAAYKAEPDHGDAYYSLANLKTYQFDDAEVAAMRSHAAREELSPSARIHFCFALGKAYEDRGDTENAFKYYDQGNTLKRVQMRYKTEDMLKELEAHKTHCTPELFAAQTGKGDPSLDPIFIVGLPRAGSTLLEQILASHSQVDGTLELPNILATAHKLRGRKALTDRDRYPRILHELSGDKLRELGGKYIEDTRIHRKDAPFFTDKMPNNFRHIGLIHLILPNAKIIDARREPMSCCWSGFKQLFAEGQEFTYGLEEIGRYYRAYVDLMDHWDTVLPGKVLRVQHEDVVCDLETQVRRLLDHCNLPFEPDCLAFHENERAVRTASSEQVRQPINTRGLDAWRVFEPHLDELKRALGPDLAPQERDPS